VVKAINWKVASSRSDEKIFLSIYLILPTALGPGVYSASNRNEYQKQRKCFWRVERGQCLRLTTLPPSVSRLSRQSYMPPRPVEGITFNVDSCSKGNCGVARKVWRFFTHSSSFHLYILLQFCLKAFLAALFMVFCYLACNNSLQNVFWMTLVYKNTELFRKLNILSISFLAPTLKACLAPWKNLSPLWEKCQCSHY
jgi:hypothetical protein